MQFLTFKVEIYENSEKSGYQAGHSSRKYLEKEKWVMDLISDGKMKNACNLAAKYQGRDSYSEIYKAIRKIEE